LKHARAAVARPVPAGRPFTRPQAASVPEPLRPPGPAGIVGQVSSLAERFAPLGPVLPRPAPREVSPEARPDDPIAVAEALGIPWQSLLEAEIHAERTLRGFVGEPEADLPLWRFLSALPTTALDSFRVRERLVGLLRDARLTRSGAAVRSVRQAIDEMCGKRGGGECSESQALALHLSLAHERVRELARVARAAERIRGERHERLARLTARTGCTVADAAWALERAATAGRTHAIDDAVPQARAEGFEIPAADSEFHAFLLLGKLVRRNRPVRSRLSGPGRRPRTAHRTTAPHRSSRRLAS